MTTGLNRTSVGLKHITPEQEERLQKSASIEPAWD